MQELSLLQTSSPHKFEILILSACVLVNALIPPTSEGGVYNNGIDFARGASKLATVALAIVLILKN